jgi:hypothetical protein
VTITIIKYANIQILDMLLMHSGLPAKVQLRMKKRVRREFMTEIKIVDEVQTADKENIKADDKSETKAVSNKSKKGEKKGTLTNDDKF